MNTKILSWTVLACFTSQGALAVSPGPTHRIADTYNQQRTDLNAVYTAVTANRSEADQIFFRKKLDQLGKKSPLPVAKYEGEQTISLSVQNKIFRLKAISTEAGTFELNGKSLTFTTSKPLSVFWDEVEKLVNAREKADITDLFIPKAYAVIGIDDAILAGITAAIIYIMIKYVEKKEETPLSQSVEKCKQHRDELRDLVKRGATMTNMDDQITALKAMMDQANILQAQAKPCGPNDDSCYDAKKLRRCLNDSIDELVTLLKHNGYAVSGAKSKKGVYDVGSVQVIKSAGSSSAGAVQ